MTGIEKLILPDNGAAKTHSDSTYRVTMHLTGNLMTFSWCQNSPCISIRPDHERERERERERVTLKHVYTLDPTTSGWAGYAVLWA